MKLAPKDYIEICLGSFPVAYVKEFTFSANRKFRFDYAIPVHMIAIEYEGIMSKKARHTSVTGYSRDTTKYNLAAIEGWRVLRYTALNYRNFYNDLEALLKHIDS